MKKALALCLFLLAFSFFGCSLAEDSAALDPSKGPDSESGKILEVGVIANAEVVNIRQSASMEGRVLDTARRGELFLVEDSGVADAEGDLWVKIRYRGESAFVHSDYLHQMVWDENTLINIGQVTDRDVYIYSAPRTDSDILYRSYKGEPLILYATDDADWYKVFYSKGEAFVSAEQVTVRTAYINELLE